MYNNAPIPLNTDLINNTTTTPTAKQYNYRINHNEVLTLRDDDRALNVAQQRMSDLLKRKTPPKRKSQNTARSKTRQEDPTNFRSSMMQDLINKATTTLGNYL